MRKAFTLIELMVAVGVLAVVMTFAGAIFRFGIDSQRLAMANAEIMRKFRAITHQLSTDFAGLRKDGEIFVVWSAAPARAQDPNYDGDGYVRFDRIMFFASGAFQSYKDKPKVIEGDLARICYIVANRPPPQLGVDDPVRPPAQRPRERILARTQHILTTDADLGNFWGAFTGSDAQWVAWNNILEHDNATPGLELWKNIPWVINASRPREANKRNMLAVIADVGIDNLAFNQKIGGAMVDRSDPNSIHMILCEGVGEFKIQGWFEPLMRWVPEVNPDGDRRGNLADSDFVLVDPANPGAGLHPDNVPGVLYPYPPNGAVKLGGVFAPGKPFAYDPNQLNQAHFNQIPGLGRALKFTFTLYDSKGVLKEGRTFTHIVELDK